MTKATIQPSRVLVVDDDPMTRQMTVLLVEACGYEVVAVTNGRDAIAAVEREPFSLILMDIQMPGMDGYETLAVIRGRERPGSRMPVVALTRLGGQEYLYRWLETGFDGHLSKPITLQEVRAALDQFAGPVPPGE